MKKVNIKIVFPEKIYGLRKIKVKDSSGKIIDKIPPNTSWVIEIDETINSLTFSIDLYRTTVELQPSNLEEFCLVSFHYRKGWVWLDFFRLSSFTAQVVSKEEFEAASIQTIYSRPFKKMKNVDWLSYSVAMLLSLFLLVYSLVNVKEQSGIIFLFSGTSVLSLLYLAYQRNQLFIYQYKTRLLATGLLLFSLTFLGHFNFQSFSVNHFVFLLSLLVITRTLIYEYQEVRACV